MKEYDVAIIGAGSAGLTARAEVAKHTENYLVLDGGILGTTCARVGCMPSKALIEVANTLHKQQHFQRYGLKGSLAPDYPQIMAHVRGLRDRFAGGVVRGMEKWQAHFTPKNARFIDPHTLDLGDETIRAKKIIIATGSKPLFPKQWHQYQNFFVDTDSFFELETLPRRIAVLGLGPIGIELGQALARLGIEVVAFIRRKVIGGLTDPEIQDYAYQCFAEEMNVEIGAVEILGKKEDGLAMRCNGKIWTVDRVLLARGRHPAVQALAVENLGVQHLDDRGIPHFDPGTMQIANLPVFIAGDVNGIRPILHEAADEGRIAGYNAITTDIGCFKKRTPLQITFTSPNIALLGQSYENLTHTAQAFVVGETSYDRQGRALIMGQNRGKVHLYGDARDGRLLGAEMIAPAGEHMAHLLAWAIAAEMRAAELLAMPFYHPVLEEALRKALREIVKQTEAGRPEFEFNRCDDGLFE